MSSTTPPLESMTKEQLECHKFAAEIRNLRRSQLHVVQNWLGGVTACVAIAVAVTQCSRSKRELLIASIDTKQAKLDKAQLDADIAKNQNINQSLQNEIETKRAELARTQQDRDKADQARRSAIADRDKLQSAVELLADANGIASDNQAVIMRLNEAIAPTMEIRFENLSAHPVIAMLDDKEEQTVLSNGHVSFTGTKRGDAPVFSIFTKSGDQPRELIREIRISDDWWDQRVQRCDVQWNGESITRAYKQ